MNNLVILTLTCNNRNALFETIQSFVNNTSFDQLDWVIFAQGCTVDHIERLQNLTKNVGNKVNFNVVVSEKNLGFSKGHNHLAEYGKSYKYVLMVEDDWYCLPSRYTNLENNWLTTSLSFLEENRDVSTLFLRKYRNDREKHQFGWTRSIPYMCHQYKDNFNYSEKMKDSKIVQYKDIKFQHIPNFLFTTNPYLRRNEDYSKCGVFPLPEYPDISSKIGEWKLTGYGDAQNWGWCEALTMEKIRHLITYNVGSGIFGHNEDWRDMMVSDHDKN